MDALAGQLAAHSDDDFCSVTTRGRFTGRAHEIEIWFALDGTTLYLLSGGRDRSDWVRNVIADPAVVVRVGDVSFAAAARLVDPESHEDARARALVFDKYAPGHGELDDWRVRALPVALDVHGRVVGDDPQS